MLDDNNINNNIVVAYRTILITTITVLKLNEHYYLKYM